MIQWGWSYFTRNRGARLITGENTLSQAETSNGDGRSPANQKSAVEV